MEVRGIVHRAMFDRVVHALKEAGVPHLTVTKVQAIGAGVNSAPVALSLEEGTAYADKAMVQFICERGRADAYAAALERAAHTGRPGDGIVSVHPVAGVTKIRTGERGPGALGERRSRGAGSRRSAGAEREPPGVAVIEESYTHRRGP